MRSLYFLVLVIVMCLPVVAGAQTRRTGTARKTTTQKAAPAPVKPDFTAEIQKTADTVKAITKFVYVYGRISNGLEAADEQSRRSRLTADVIEKNADNKNAVIRSIEGLKVQIDELGTVLQAKPQLQVPYINLAGVTQKIAEAVELVRGSQYNEAGKSLVTASDRLTDVLLQIK